MPGKLLLLSCCAPCSCAVIERLAQEKRDFAVVFYNPNIRPEAEYRKRCDENKRVCDFYGVEFIELEYDNRRWVELTTGLEDEPERGRRCSICFYMRLKRVMAYAREHGFSEVASVLGVSRYKDLNQVNEAAAGRRRKAAHGMCILKAEKAECRSAVRSLSGNWLCIRSVIAAANR